MWKTCDPCRTLEEEILLVPVATKGEEMVVIREEEMVALTVAEASTAGVKTAEVAGASAGEEEEEGVEIEEIDLVVLIAVAVVEVVHRHRARSYVAFIWRVKGAKMVTAAGKFIYQFHVLLSQFNKRFSHEITMAARLQAHPKPVKGLGVLADGGILSGSTDQSMKMWNPSPNGGFDLHETLSLMGDIIRIEVMDPLIIWSMDVMIPEFPHEPVGQLHLMNLSDGSRHQLQRSDTMPYAHPQSIYQFAVRIVDSDLLVVSGGLEGMLHMWTFSGATSQVSYLGPLEGHVRGVTCLVLSGAVYCSSWGTSGIICYKKGGVCVYI